MAPRPSWRPPLNEGVARFFGFFKAHPAWAGLIALVNLVGIAYGFYYYQRQFAVTPAWLWWLVPDSPLAVLWAQLALLSFWLLRRKAGVLDALAFIGNVQVGLWTCFVLLAYEDGFHTLDFLQGEGPVHLNSVLWVGHLGMAVLALVFLQGLRERASVDRRGAALAVALAAGYYLLQDAVDYFGPDYRGVGCGMRPYTVPCDGREPLLAAVTFGLTLAAAGALAWSTLRRPNQALDDTKYPPGPTLEA